MFCCNHYTRFNYFLTVFLCKITGEIQEKTGRDLKSRPALHGFGLVFKSLQTTRPIERLRMFTRFILHSPVYVMPAAVLFKDFVLGF